MSTSPLSTASWNVRVQRQARRVLYAVCGGCAIWAIFISIRPTRLLISGQCAEATVRDVYNLEIDCPRGAVQFYDGTTVVDAVLAGYFQRGEVVRVWYLPQVPGVVDDAASLKQMAGGACLSLGGAIVFGVIACFLRTR